MPDDLLPAVIDDALDGYSELTYERIPDMVPQEYKGVLYEPVMILTPQRRHTGVIAALVSGRPIRKTLVGQFGGLVTFEPHIMASSSDWPKQFEAKMQAWLRQICGDYEDRIWLYGKGPRQLVSPTARIDPASRLIVPGRK